MQDPSRRLRLLFFLFIALLPATAAADIRSSKHNLSSSGPGALRADSESRICIFCHTPHNASQSGGVLWNRADSTATYIPYDSATLRATLGQPTGASKLCLSCHDGTVALGWLLSEPLEVGFVGGVRFLPPGSSQLGTDLSDDHPISFDYDANLAAANPELADPSTLTGAVRLDPFGQLQCTSCHDPHDTGFGLFLVAPTQKSSLCLVCHEPTDWNSSSHATSVATWSGTAPNPWPHTEFDTVADNACENCHRPHSAGGREWILNLPMEEDNCLVCHNGSVATTDIQSEISLPFHHPVEMETGVHTPDEDPTLPMTTHVECSDCHDPHATHAASSAAPPVASGALRGVSGVGQNGTALQSVAYEYEVCYKCHGEFSMTNPSITRQHVQNSTLLQFDLSNPSYHPVVGIGRSLSVPSLLPPLIESSLIYCTDCHAGDRGPGAGGAGPAGPHGSSFPPLLERQYNTLDGIPYSANFYSLCYKCHSETSILANQSFPEHNKHILDVDTPCSVCHDAHGISSTQGNSVNNSHLINFDLSVVSPGQDSGLLEFQDFGNRAGSCSLLCHGKNHDADNASY
jgi:predicted CXXCH cytochrome family protein